MNPNQMDVGMCQTDCEKQDLCYRHLDLQTSVYDFNSICKQNDFKWFLKILSPEATE